MRKTKKDRPIIINGLELLIHRHILLEIEKIKEKGVNNEKNT